MKQSEVKLHLNGKAVISNGPITNPAMDTTHNDLNNVGVDFRAMDSGLIGPAVTNGSISSSALETWLPGTLRMITNVNNIDEIAGITTIGRFEDDTINTRVLEAVGKAEFYGDNSNIPLADYNPSTEKREVARFEQGFQVGMLEELRQSSTGFQAANEKRSATIQSLNNSRNEVGFSGISGTSTYGLLNDPNLPSYMSYADVGVGGGQPWLASGTFASITKDLTRMVSAIETQMGGNLQDNAQMVMVLATGYRSIFNVREATTGVSVRQWLDDTYPNVRVVYTPKFKGAYTAKDVVYLFVENAGAYDDADVGGASVIQAVPVRYQVIGSEQRVKGYVEDAVMATAGVIVLRPWAFARYVVSA